ncbi:protein COFACTOR ASSEMBLY OF COMPLEX C SUBUNIT B CCB1, chloroplastic-like [Bidens hawaiensis]|uniref:protein COFACTOR ASSEMBLY OF COMPLEX C SUBUNIT B CCB1, chloroplastic-like n=1 Tax=Bidens hawaiensis TaxID=980011 RepID=UPI00404ACD2B
MAVAKQQLLLPPLNLNPKLPSIYSLHRQQQPWKNKRTPISASLLLHETSATISAIQSPLLVIADAAVGYSTASYYTSLGLFVISVPGLWSLIKRSVKSKVVKKTFVEDSFEGNKMKKTPNQVAGEILSFFTRNNFSVVDRGETITFEGEMVPSRGQAALLTFCTCISLASVALVLTITVPDVGNNWFAITLLSPLAGVYYWKRASRKEQIKVRMTVAEDGTLSEIIIQGDDQQVDQMRKELKLSEKGMVYVKGIFER